MPLPALTVAPGEAIDPAATADAFAPPANAVARGATQASTRLTAEPITPASKLAEIKQRESGGDPFVGYTPPGEKRVDLSKAPLDETGFPIWEGRQGPAGISHAAGLYQFQPGTWRPIARELGIKDFSEQSQERVAAVLYEREGERPWAASAPGGGGARLPPLTVVGSADSAASAGTSLAESVGTGLSYATPEGMPVGETAMEYSRASAALLNGVRRGLMEPPLAVAQMTLPRETMEPLETKLRQLESSTDYLRNEYPNIDMVGRLTGATVSVMAGARLLGAVGPLVLPAMATRAAQAVWQGVGAVGRGAATGAAIGATNFYPAGPDEERRPFGVNARAFDTGVGSVLGVLGGSIARSLEWGARNLADTAFGRGFMGLVQQTTNGTSRNTGEAQTQALQYYERVTTQSRQNYAVRNAAGREIEGFPTGVGATEAGTQEGFQQAIDRAVQTSRDEGVKSWVGGVAQSVKKTLGVEREEARLAETTALQKEYNDAVSKLVPSSVPANMRAQVLSQYQRAGGQVPTPPPAFVAAPAIAADYAQARTEINAAISRAVSSKNVAVETQLKMMLHGIDEVAESAAVKDGVSRAAFIRQREAADKYFKETVVPLRKFFDGKPYERAIASIEQGGVSTAQVYDKIAAVVNKDDVELARALGRVLGPRGRESMVEVMAAEALRMGELQGEKSAIDYVIKHQNVIRELVGRDAYAEVAGMAKVAGTLTERVKQRSPRVFDWSHSVAPVFAISALMAGNYQHMAKIMMVLPAYHIGLAAIQRIHQTPIAKGLMRRAARMKPGSAELEALVDRTERVIRDTTTVGTRAIGEASTSQMP